MTTDTITFVEVRNTTETIAQYYGPHVCMEISENGQLIIADFEEAFFITEKESATTPNKTIDKRRCINGKIFYNTSHWAIATNITMEDKE